jgi:hypothetical protein
MAVRGRPASSTPEQTVEKLSDQAHIPRPHLRRLRSGEGEI